jgi:hypothetical protein
MSITRLCKYAQTGTTLLLICAGSAFVPTASADTITLSSTPVNAIQGLRNDSRQIQIGVCARFQPAVRIPTLRGTRSAFRGSIWDDGSKRKDDNDDNDANDGVRVPEPEILVLLGLGMGWLGLLRQRRPKT